MSLDKFPSLTDWKSYSAVKSSLANGVVFRNSDRVLKTIDDLVEAYKKPAYKDNKAEILFNLYLACRFWLKKVNTPYENDKDPSVKTLRLQGQEGRRDPIDEMAELCERKLRKIFTKQGVENVDSKDLDVLLGEAFGLSVKEGLRANDLRAAEGGMPYIRNEAERRQFKLSFRNGIAHRWIFTADGKDEDRTKTELVEYDTIKFQDTGSRRGESDVGLFVMGTNGRIYTGVDKSKYRGHVHSYFFAGETVYCAGMMGVKNGKVMTVSGSSGHYGPSVLNILAVLQRLAAYGVNLQGVKVRRINEKNTEDKLIEEIPAVKLMASRQWPTGDPRFKNSMWINKTD